MHKALMPMLLALVLLLPTAGCLALSVKAGSCLAGTAWVLSSYGHPDTPSVVADSVRITLKWSADGNELSGHTGCNLYTGTVHIRGNLIEVISLVQTEMACLDSRVMAQEADYLKLLAQAQSWETEGDCLILAGAGGEVLVYRKEGKVQEEFLSNLAGTSWKLTTLGMEGAASSVIFGTNITLNFNEGAVSIAGTGGVNNYRSSVRINGTEMEVLGIISTKMFGDNPPGLMGQETKFFGLLSRAQTFAATADKLTIYCGDDFLVFVAASGKLD